MTVIVTTPLRSFDVRITVLAVPTFSENAVLRTVVFLEELYGSCSIERDTSPMRFQGSAALTVPRSYATQVSLSRYDVGLACKFGYITK